MFGSPAGVRPEVSRECFNRPRAWLCLAAVVTVALAATAVVAKLGGVQGGRQRAHGPLPHEAYLWQRDWGRAVQESVREHGSRFEQLTYLAGEIRWV